MMITDQDSHDPTTLVFLSALTFIQARKLKSGNLDKDLNNKVGTIQECPGHAHLLHRFTASRHAIRLPNTPASRLKAGRTVLHQWNPQNFILLR